jgi:acyl-CoA reductase-like NAD-dependent aldehyde dehydrogenase
MYIHGNIYSTRTSAHAGIPSIKFSVNRLKVGDPMHQVGASEPIMGPLVSKGQYEKVLRYIEV